MAVTLDDILKEIKTMSKNITEIKTSQEKLVTDNTLIQSTLDSIQNTLPEMKNQLNTHNEQISSIERDKRRKNLIFLGVKDDLGEKRMDTEKKLCELIEKLLESEFNLQELDFCRRIGKFQTDKHRAIIAGFTTERKKYEILRNCHKLKGTVISVRHDLPDDLRKKRKTLVEEMKRARAEGKEAFVAYDKVVIRDKVQPDKGNQKRAHSASPEVPNKKSTLAEVATGSSNVLKVDDIMMGTTPAQKTGNVSQQEVITVGTQPLINNFLLHRESNQTTL